jgi:hypothetical protein
MGFLGLFFNVVLFVGFFAYAILTKLDKTLSGPIVVVDSHQDIESLLNPYKPLLGEDFDGYRGHLYRVFSYANHILKGDRSHDKAIATALVFHDIGLWTDNTLAYLEPSWRRAQEKIAADFSQEEQQLVHDIILWHHKITAFDGPHADVVNAVRRADWIDATQGYSRQGMPGTHIDLVSSQIPPQGFYDTLKNFGPKLHGNDYFRIMKDMLSILRF